MACHYCGQCNRGCQVKANFSSGDVLIAPALATGKLTLITNAMAREVTVGADGLANGVSYIDKNTNADEHVRAKVVVLAASAMESARLLLNSKSTQFPNGLANSSGMVGKYLTDTTGAGVSGHIPALEDHVPHNHDGVGGMHVYMPWWLDNKKLDFPRGYHIEVYGGRGQPCVRVRRRDSAAQRRRLRQAAQGRLSQVLRRVDRVRRTRRDDPQRELVLRARPARRSIASAFRCFASTGSSRTTRYNQAKHMQETFRALIVAMGGTPSSPMPSREQNYGLAAGGTIIHELGGARMGSGSDDVRRERELPGARREESLRRRRRAVRVAGGQESHVDDPRALVAHERLHRAAARGGGDMSTTSDDRDHEGADTTSSDATISRRRMLQVLGAVPVAAALGHGDRARSQVGRAGDVSQPPRRPRRRFFTQHEWKTVRVLVDYIIPRDDVSGSATDAKVPEYMDYPARREGREPGDAGRDARRARVDRHRVGASDSARRSSTPTDAQRRQILDDIAYPQKAQPGDVARRCVLQSACAT